ncbi:MAG: penicillin-binding transpeptidase domain-containing protein, partial [Gemmatimonadales bacterium]
VFREATARLSPVQGFASHVLGRVGEVTAERLDQLGPPYKRGDEVGLSGLERAFETHLAGSPVVEVVLTNQFGTPIEVLYRSDGRSAQDLATTLEPAVQRAVERALDGAATPSAIVVLDAASGEIRGLGSRPLTDFNRALGARYPPGSTFKIVTAAALLHAGLDPDTSVSCPAEVTVGSRIIHNAGATNLGGISLREAFAHSCNTTFAALGADLNTGDLVAAAERFGFGSTYELPLPVAGGQFPAPESVTEQGAASIGQARVLASPLHMATVAAAAATGEWLPPSLLGDQAAPGTSLDIDIATLQEMMRAVVDYGTGTAAGVAGEPVHGKTGSAEFGEEDPAPTHAWFVGYREELAFAVFVEGGGAGGTVAAPVAAELMTAIVEERQATALVTCAVGPWTTFQGTGERTGCGTTTGIETPRIAWGTYVGIQGWLNSPVVSGEMVYTGSAGAVRGQPDAADGVYALDLNDGSLVWRHLAGNDVNGVAIADDLVVATADEGVVWALNRTDGSVAWVFPTDEAVVGPIYTNPLIVDELVFVGSAAGVLYALDVTTGEAQWTAQLDTSIRGGAATDGEAIYVVGEAGDARGFSLDGYELWRRSLTFDSITGDTLTARVFAAPTVVGDLIVVPYIRDTSYPSPALVALDKYIGSIQWEASDPDSVRDAWGNLRSSPAVIDGELVIADPIFAGIVGIDAKDGSASWALNGGTLCHAHWPSPAWSGTTAFIPQHDGGLYAFDVDAGELAWSLYLGAGAEDGAFPSTLLRVRCLEETAILASPAIAP